MSSFAFPITASAEMNSYFDQEISFWKKLFLSFLFALAYAQSPLFSSNQNTYFLHGLADAKQGFLNLDWMANSADPFPLFSFLVEQTSAYLPAFFFHLYYLIVLGVFMFSVLGIAGEVWKLKPRAYLNTFLIITGLFSLFFSFLSSKILGVNLSYLFQNGLANQYALGPVLQPSTFGIFLFLSIYLFLKNKRIFSILALAFAVNIHATYLLSAAFFTLAYMLILAKNKDIKGALYLGVLSLIVVLPNLLYTYFTFSSQPEESVLAAQKILVDLRIPHHTKPAQWFGLGSVFRISLLLFAMFVIRKKREIFLIIALPFSLAMILSLVQVFSQSYFLALLFPWRVSVLLVPMSVFLLVGKCVEALEYRKSFLSERALGILGLVALAFLVISGVASVFLQYKNDVKRPSYALEEMVKSTKKGSSIYLVPPGLERFRLRTSASIFIDKKTHPYKSDEVEEWYRRLVMADRFYVKGSADCSLLDKIMIENELTHVVDNRPLTCTFLTAIYEDENFRLFERKEDAPK